MFARHLYVFVELLIHSFIYLVGNESLPFCTFLGNWLFVNKFIFILYNVKEMENNVQLELIFDSLP